MLAIAVPLCQRVGFGVHCVTKFSGISVLPEGSCCRIDWSRFRHSELCDAVRTDRQFPGLETIKPLTNCHFPPAAFEVMLFVGKRAKDMQERVDVTCIDLVTIRHLSRLAICWKTSSERRMIL